jgi:hypothetical protein
MIKGNMTLVVCHNMVIKTVLDECRRYPGCLPMKEQRKVLIRIPHKPQRLCTNQPLQILRLVRDEPHTGDWNRRQDTRCLIPYPHIKDIQSFNAIAGLKL